MNTDNTLGTIFIVDDMQENIRVLTQVLIDHNYKVRSSKSGMEALTSINRERPDMILLDIDMPNMNGYEVCKRLKKNEKTIEIPVLFLSGLDGTEDKIRGFAVGGVDYIIKPFKTEEIIARIQTHLEISRYRTLQDEKLKLINEQLNVELKERRQAEKQLFKYKDAIEHNPATIVITNRDGIIEYVNPKFTRLTGYSYEEAVGQNPRVLKSGKMSTETYHEMWETIISGNVWQGEIINKKKNGELYWENGLISPIKDFDEKITHFVAVKEDITERKKAEEKIKNLNENLKIQANELIQANKELESFSYSVSHDLRNPLKIIDGFTNILREDYSDKLDDEGKEYISYIQSATSRMNLLITDILSLSVTARAEINRKRIDLSSIAESIAEGLQSLEPDRKVEFIIAREITANADEGLIKVVMENLFGNAFKYTSKEDLPKIEFGICGSEGPKIYFVRDNGAGFDMKYSEYLFAPFKRLHSNKDFEGTGIGLATVHRIINRHGGKIWAESEVNVGTTFYFYLE